MIRLLLCTFLLSLLLVSSAVAQTVPPVPNVSLSVPLLEGRPAPFSGLLITVAHASQCIEDAVAVTRLTVELAVRTTEMSTSSALRDVFIDEQRTRIAELSATSWWDDNGNIFMLSLGLILGVTASALIAGLVIN